MKSNKLIKSINALSIFFLLAKSASGFSLPSGEEKKTFEAQNDFLCRVSLPLDAFDVQIGAIEKQWQSGRAKQVRNPNYRPDQDITSFNLPTIYTFPKRTNYRVGISYRTRDLNSSRFHPYAVWLDRIHAPCDIRVEKAKKYQSRLEALLSQITAPDLKKWDEVNSVESYRGELSSLCDRVDGDWLRKADPHCVDTFDSITTNELRRSYSVYIQKD